MNECLSQTTPGDVLAALLFGWVLGVATVVVAVHTVQVKLPGRIKTLDSAHVAAAPRWRRWLP
ncbi:MAG TPA: hypothetical protein VGI39_17955 [Polyangiaceae bacterium]|jgi:hypothetical protein